MALRIPELERKSETDQKTGLFNHHHFMAQFNNELQRANRYDRPLSIIMADLDLLRNINNTYGHLAGDDVLKGVADILKQTVREYDLVARFGGEEFAILMPEAEIDKAIERAEHIRKAIESARFVVPTSVQPIKVTMSFGISKRENFEQSPEEIIHHADTALYRSKLNGRNTSLALINNSFLKAGSTESAQPTIEDINATQVIHEDEKLTSDYAAAATIYLKQTPEPDMKSAGPVGHSEGKPEGTVNSRKPFASHVSVQNYISLLSVSAIIALLITLKLSTEVIAAYSPVHWLGFAAIAFTIVLTEWFSISLYVRNTSLSTSAVPIIALVILFGPLGTLVASLVFALRRPLNLEAPSTGSYLTLAITSSPGRS
jgi:diguanylate cyclase (GGDEF)-like protein